MQAAIYPFEVSRVRTLPVRRPPRRDAPTGAADTATPSGTWLWRPAQGLVQWQSTMEPDLFPKAGQMQLSDWLECVHPLDRSPLIARLRRAAMFGLDVWLRFRAAGADGEERWVEGEAVCVADAQGGSMVSARLRPGAQRPANDEAEERFRVAVESMIDPFGMYRAVRDGTGRIADFEITYLNSAACSTHCLRPGSHEGRRLGELLPGFCASALFDGFVAAVEERGPLRLDVQLDATRRDGGREARTYDVRVNRFADGIVAVWRDVTEANAVRARLVDLQQQKDAMTSSVAHELRNFLAPIANAASVLLAAPDGPAAKGALQVLDRQVGHLKRLISDMVDVARVGAGKLELECSPVALAEVVGRAVETAEPAIASRRQHVEIRAGEPGATVLCDPVRLCQAVTNLLLNAAKFSPAGAPIVVAWGVRDGIARVEVQDQGCGFEPAEASRLFELYAQGAQRVPGGLGIGLHLVRQIMQLHGGGAQALSEGPGRGSVFTVWLPVRPATQAEPAVGHQFARGASPAEPAPRDDRLAMPVMPAGVAGTGGSPVVVPKPA